MRKPDTIDVESDSDTGNVDVEANPIQSFCLHSYDIYVPTVGSIKKVCVSIN